MQVFSLLLQYADQFRNPRYPRVLDCVRNRQLQQGGAASEPLAAGLEPAYQIAGREDRLSAAGANDAPRDADQRRAPDAADAAAPDRRVGNIDPIDQRNRQQ